MGVTGSHDDYLSDMLKTPGAKLKLLHLGSINLVGECFSTLKDTLSDLEDLSISSSSLNEKSFNDVMRTVGPIVKRLKLERLKFVGSVLDLSSVSLSQIVYLEVQGCRALTDPVVTTIIGHCGPDLKTLILENTRFSGELLAQYPVTFPLLEKLEVTGTLMTKVSDAGVCAMLRVAGRNLKHLKLSHVFKFSGKGLSEFSESLGNLESLKFESCPFSDDGFLELFSRGMSSVRSLKLISTAISGITLGNSTITFPQIQSLDLSAPPTRSQLSAEGFNNILEMCGPKLTTVNVQADLISPETEAILEKRGISVLVISR